MRIAVLVGNPKAESRTYRVALTVAAALNDQLGIATDPVVVDLAEVAQSLFDFGSPTVTQLLTEVAASDIALVASPTYKATYTGLLKAFLDRYGNDGLAGTVGIPIMTGAASVHALSPEVHLRPLLVELGASVPTRGLYITEQQFDQLDEVISAWLVQAVPILRRATAPLI
jgi:FMN reductase